ncbi:MAG: hypothetical protein HY898_31695 [Deltaproteobacteria bacterium]|nr:hypothetical protein [Deltaproteobacteria bacterium]
MNQKAFPQFDRKFFEGRERFSCIGSGSIGGKALGLALVHDVITQSDRKHGALEVSIPTLAVLGTDAFDMFFEVNEGLEEIAYSGQSDERIAHAFQRAQLPPALVGDLRALISRVHTPLAIRSSSMLEDAMFRPFAGVYATKMIPNNQPDADSRFRKLVEAVKYVYASTFFKDARAYLRTVTDDPKAEKMAVIIQEVVGVRHGERFYPHISGVARSYNFYPASHAKPEEGVVDLAVGLGKTIVDGGQSYTYSPAWPRNPPPYNNIGDLLKTSQTTFWAVNMGKPPAHDPIKETEYMVQGDLTQAEEDNVLAWVASTYDPSADRIVAGTYEKGPRLINFAPILGDDVVPLNDALLWMLETCEKTLGAKVEIEFAVTLDPDKGVPARLGFLQVRPMVVSTEEVDLTDEEMSSTDALLAAEHVMGNGTVEDLVDIVYVKPESFEAKISAIVAEEVAAMNQKLTDEKRPYLLIGFGRWGSSDPWLGIQVNWGQIAGARVIVEATLPSMTPDFSQGSHFFHNLSSFRVLYFSVSHTSDTGIRWDWLAQQQVVSESEHVRHVRLPRPMRVKVDGRKSRGVVLR